MFILNVTIKVDWSIEPDWLLWMKDAHIPAMLATGHFQHYQFVRLMEVDEADGPTYAIQYYANTRDDYQKYLEKSAINLNLSAVRKWGSCFVTFETLMEVIH